jgi:hypothetical protein
VKFVAVALMAVLGSTTLVGCSSTHNYNLECDAGDYTEHDSDCGYVDSAGMWQYFSWTSPGKTTYSPDGWEPPAGVVIQQDNDSSHHKPKKRTTKPTPKVTIKK